MCKSSDRRHTLSTSYQPCFVTINRPQQPSQPARLGRSLVARTHLRVTSIAAGCALRTCSQEPQLAPALLGKTLATPRATRTASQKSGCCHVSIPRTAMPPATPNHGRRSSRGGGDSFLIDGDCHRGTNIRQHNPKLEEKGLSCLCYTRAWAQASDHTCPVRGADPSCTFSERTACAWRARAKAFPASIHYSKAASAQVWQPCAIL